MSEWIEIGQERIDRFADVTGDRQWIHLDAGRAAKESPHHATIAHGFLTLSLLTTLLDRAVRVEGVTVAVNYGLNRVRFVSPVTSGARIRARFTPRAVERAGHGVQVTWMVVVEREQSEKPCCVAEWIVRYALVEG